MSKHEVNINVDNILIAIVLKINQSKDKNLDILIECAYVHV